MNAIAFDDDLVAVDLGMGEGQARVVRVGDGGTTVLADITDQIVLPLGLAARDDNLWVGDWYTGMVWQLIADGQELARTVRWWPPVSAAPKEWLLTSTARCSWSRARPAACRVFGWSPARSPRW